MNKSSTMRIDLIPDISDVPISEKPKASFVSVGGKTGVRRVSPSAQQPGAGHGGYGELFQNIYDAGIVTDLHGRIRDVNGRAMDSFGYSPEEFSHLNIEDIIAGADDELIRTLYENLQNECFTLMQAYCVRADGAAFPAEVAISQLRLSTPHLCFFVRDETVRRQADEMLRTEHNALQNASDAIVVIDMQARIEYANPATARIWGFPSASELVGKSLGRLLLNEADGQEIVSSLSGEHFMTSGVAVAIRHDGEPFRVNIRAACNRNTDGNVVGAVLSFSDLTARDRVQSAERDAVRLKDTLQRLDEFRHVLKCGIGEVVSLIHDFQKENVSLGEALDARVVSVADACEGLTAVLADVEELIGDAVRETQGVTDFSLED